MDSSRVRRKGKASTGGGNDIKFKRAEEIQEGEGKGEHYSHVCYVQFPHKSSLR